MILIASYQYFQDVMFIHTPNGVFFIPNDFAKASMILKTIIHVNDNTLTNISNVLKVSLITLTNRAYSVNNML